MPTYMDGTTTKKRHVSADFEVFIRSESESAAHSVS